MPPSPRLKVTGGNGDSDTLHRLQPKLWSKRAGENFHRRITDVDECSISDSGADSARAEAAECLVSVPMCEIPPDFPYTTGPHPTEDGTRARF